MNNIALGQFYPSSSVMHRLDPRMKIIIAIAYIVASFLCKNVISFALLLVSAFALILLSRIPVKIVLRSIKAIIFIMIFTAVLNVFWTKGDAEELLVSWKFIQIYMSGIYNAVFIAVRIIAMIIGTSIFLTYTTTPIQLTDAIEQLLAPLKLLKVPVHEFAMMMTIALRFIPTIVEETEKIMAAQKARGADFTNGSLAKRAKALIPVLIPLFISAFRRAGELATAMTCRCYRGGKGRTKLNVLRFTYRDFIALVFIAAFIAGIVLLNIYAPGYSM
ncbi:MAG: energy-coupling factor transporter transmembrane protein EcfT [Ruminococcaceae bacterium]|nr:energy-coupling factor transporter transmembrane protein EcfT [Oscillospiraceae bacterium]